jgi:hypothetical protein
VRDEVATGAVEQCAEQAEADLAAWERADMGCVRPEMAGGGGFQVGERGRIWKCVPIGRVMGGASPRLGVDAGGKIDPGLSAPPIMGAGLREAAAMPAEDVGHRANTRAASSALSTTSIPAP